jgi:hypothetical protein
LPPTATAAAATAVTAAVRPLACCSRSSATGSSCTCGRLSSTRMRRCSSQG